MHRKYSSCIKKKWSYIGMMNSGCRNWTISSRKTEKYTVLIYGTQNTFLANDIKKWSLSSQSVHSGFASAAVPVNSTRQMLQSIPCLRINTEHDAHTLSVYWPGIEVMASHFCRIIRHLCYQRSERPLFLSAYMTQVLVHPWTGNYSR